MYSSVPSPGILTIKFPILVFTSQDASQLIFVPPITPPCCLLALKFPLPSLSI